MVRDWLRTYLEPSEGIPGGEYVFGRYKQFLSILPGLCEQQHLNPESLIFYEYISFLQGWLEGKGLREEQTS